jgi:SAM-dependent methyltransferase
MNDSELYDAKYFQNRFGNDRLRQASYKLEKSYIEQHLGRQVFSSGSMLDVGCGTGEFIEAIGWNMDTAFGMEVSEHARSSAEDRGIRFTPDLFNAEEFFDLVVFRGTIQHLPDPFEYIFKASKALKRGGHVLFLATPNSNSIYYRRFKTLPFIDERFNYWIPCDIALCTVLRKYGFRILDVTYPYLGTPYANPTRDHLRFVRKLLFRTEDKFAFWRSSMTVLAQRPIEASAPNC